MRPSSRTLWMFGAYALTFVAAGALRALGAPALVVFAGATVALAAGAVAVGEATEPLSTRLSPAATGIVQSTATTS